MRFSVNMDENDMVIVEHMTKKERSLKTKYVLSKHITADGQPRLIKEPYGTIKGWSTHIQGKRRITAKTYDGLIDKLFDIYSNGLMVSTFENLFELALADKELFKSDNTIVKYRADFKRFINDDMRSKYLHEFSLEYLKVYSVTLIKEKQLKPEAFRAYKSVLNLVFNYAVSKGLAEYNIAGQLLNDNYYSLCVQSTKTAEDKAMSPEQIEILTKEVNNRINHPEKYNVSIYVNGYMFLLSKMSGMRAAELCSLKWRDVKADRIHIHSQQLKNRKTNEYKYVPWTKNEKGVPRGGRYFPITNEIQDLLEKIKAEYERYNILSEWVFCNADGSWIIADTCYEKFLYRMCKGLKFSLTNNHAIRMYFNSYVLIPKGISVTNRARLLGHSTEVNFKNYSFADYNYCDQAMDALNM